MTANKSITSNNWCSMMRKQGGQSFGRNRYALELRNSEFDNIRPGDIHWREQ